MAYSKGPFCSWNDASPDVLAFLFNAIESNVPSLAWLYQQAAADKRELGYSPPNLSSLARLDSIRRAARIFFEGKGTRFWVTAIKGGPGVSPPEIFEKYTYDLVHCI